MDASAMSQPTVFDLNPALARPKGRAAWVESFTPVLAELRSALAAAAAGGTGCSLRRSVGCRSPGVWPSVA